jgi:hypothetical protein
MSPRPAGRLALALLCGALLIAAAPSRAGVVRPPAVAGSWYPDRPSLISAEVDRLTRAAAAGPTLRGRPIALVVPHAGWRFSGFAAAAAYRNLNPGDFDRVVVVGPSHHVPFSGFAVPTAAAYRTPAGEVPLCRKALDRLVDGRIVRVVPEADAREHSIEIELPFLQERLDAFCLVPILAGRTDPAMQKELAARLARLRDGRTLFVFSSDFTHYGPNYDYVPYGPSAIKARESIRALDARAVGYLLTPDAAGFRTFLDETADTICGRDGIQVLLELMPRLAPGAKAVRLAQYASIDVPGLESDSAVTYVALAYVDGDPLAGEPLGPPPRYDTCPSSGARIGVDLGNRLLKVARATLATELRGADDLRRALRDLPVSARAEMSRLQAAFVTLNRTDARDIARLGRLRGCIGQVYPAYPLPEAVVLAAAGAALQDPRFPPVKPEELPGLEVELTVLSPPQAIESWRTIELGRHGIVLKKGDRRAVFLPHVPVEEGWTVEQTLSHLSQKAGLPEDAWREGAVFEVFEGQKFEEHHGAKPGDSGGL